MLAAAPSDPTPLLFDVPAARSAQASLARSVARSRPATVRSDVLVGPDGSQRLGLWQRISLPLFNDSSCPVTFGDVHREGTSRYSWTGRLDGNDLGTAVFALHDGALVGAVIMPGAIFRIGYAPDGSQVIEQ